MCYIKYHFVLEYLYKTEAITPRGTGKWKNIPGSVNYFKPGLAPPPPVGITYYKRLFPRKIYSKTRNILIF